MTQPADPTALFAHLPRARLAHLPTPLARCRAC